MFLQKVYLQASYPAQNKLEVLLKLGSNRDEPNKKILTQFTTPLKLTTTDNIGWQIEQKSY